MDDTSSKYQILSQFDVESSRTFFRAVRVADAAPVLLNMPRDQSSLNQLIRNLKQEIELVDGLTGDIIPTYIGVEEFRGNLVLVSKDPGGTLLAEIINKHPLPLALFFEISIALTRSLLSLQQQKIVHKGISPHTILYNSASQKISFADLSVARGLGRSGLEYVSANHIQGALAYISPEQTGRMNRPVDYRTDYYSLGATFFEMLTGHPPFDFSDAMEIVHAHLARELPDFDAPDVLKQVVRKLMRKQAENRYQTTIGLLADLTKCRQNLKPDGSIPGFEIGKTDKAGYFIIPDKLYGRDEQLAFLSQRFKSASVKSELVFIAGNPGIGKSALVKEFQKDVLSSGGRFIEGKFEELKRDIPYYGILSAIRSLIRQLLTESEERLAYWKEVIGQAVGINGQVLINVLPELEGIIGKQPEIVDLHPSASQDRFIETFRQFIRAFLTPRRMLVIFLDDLQWADRASLHLLSQMLKSSTDGGLLIIGGYRDNEIDALHPLTHLEQTLKQAQLKWSSITLSMLPLPCVNQLVGETLNHSQKSSALLSKLIHSKTGGNPFYVHKFMGYLSENGLIYFDDLWKWDLDRIRETEVTENVVTFMAQRIQALSSASQEILKTAACIGSQPDLELLAMMLDCTREEVHSRLEEPLQEGMIVFRDNNPFFIHDRVQEGASSLLTQNEAEGLHLKLGTHLLEKTAPDVIDDHLFTITNHLNEAGDLVRIHNLSEQTAALNLQAGTKALGSAAFELALQFSEKGLLLLGTQAWEKNHDLTAQLLILKSEALVVINDFEAFDALFSSTYDRFKDKSQQLRLLELKIHMLVGKGRHIEAVKICLEAVGQFGIHFPEAPEEVGAAIGQEMQTIQRLLSGRNPVDLLDAPAIQDQDMALASGLILRMQPAVHDYGRPDIAALMSLKNMSISLEYGNSTASPGVFAFYGGMVYFLTGDANSAHAYSKVAMELNARQGYHSTALTSFLHTWLINHWVNPIADGLEICLLGSKAGYEMGHVLFGSFITAGYVVLGGSMGMQLEELSIVAEKHGKIIDNRVESAAYHCRLERQMARALMGKTLHPLSFSDELYDEVRDIASVCQSQNLPQIGFYHYFRSRLHYYFWDYSSALSAAEEATKWLEACRATVAEFEIVFSYMLALTASAHTLKGEDRATSIQKAVEMLEKIDGWRLNCTANFEHKYLLGKAELAWLDGDYTDAIDLFTRAAQSARRYGFIQFAALAHERAGMCYRDKGELFAARGHLEEAKLLYRRWGAVAKVEHLMDHFPELDERNNPLHANKLTLHGSLDFTSVLKAAQAISGEMEPNRLYKRVMSSLIENAGAQRAVIILKKGDAWDIVDSDANLELEKMPAAPGDKTRGAFPQSVTDFVARSQEYLVLENASTSHVFGHDLYIQQKQIKSVICAPILLQNELTGLIYMENNLVAGAFTESRLEVVRILSSQAAISIRHAQLYNDQVQLAAHLEELVTKRTEELRSSLDNLKTTQGQLIQSEKLASLGRMSTGIAHELRNPLNFVSNFAKLNKELIEDLQNSAHKLPEDLLETIETICANDLQIIKHSERADNIVANLMYHARPQGTRLEVTAIHPLLDQCIGVSLRQSQRDPDNPGLLITRNYDPSNKIVASVSQGMSQVFVNLILNAIHAIEEKQKLSDQSYIPSLTFSTTLNKGEIHIAVTDNGTGIPDSNRSKIFEPFFTTNPLQSRSGLGLSLTYDIVTKVHQGKISFDSREGEGTTFTVVLPQHPR